MYIIFVGMGIYGMLFGHPAAGLFSFGMAVFMHYAHRKMLRDEAERPSKDDNGKDDQTIF